jgi:hypothetical protein
MVLELGGLAAWWLDVTWWLGGLAAAWRWVGYQCSARRCWGALPCMCGVDSTCMAYGLPRTFLLCDVPVPQLSTRRLAGGFLAAAGAGQRVGGLVGGDAGPVGMGDGGAVIGQRRTKLNSRGMHNCRSLGVIHGFGQRHAGDYWRGDVGAKVLIDVVTSSILDPPPQAKHNPFRQAPLSQG